MLPVGQTDLRRGVYSHLDRQFAEFHGVCPPSATFGVPTMDVFFIEKELKSSPGSGQADGNNKKEVG